MGDATFTILQLLYLRSSTVLYICMQQSRHIILDEVPTEPMLSEGRDNVGRVDQDDR